MLEVCPDLHVLRDPTRGGLGTSLNEIARTARVGVQLVERSIPVPAGRGQRLRHARAWTRSTWPTRASWSPSCPASDADAVLAAMRAHPLGAGAAIIGECVAEHPGMVVAKTTFGGTRVVDMPLGEQLPRIC